MIKILYYQYYDFQNFDFVLKFTKLSSISRYNYSNSFYRKEDVFNSALAYTLLCLGEKQFGLEISREDNGKPYIKGSDISISFSHTTGLVAIAISDHNIGIDCEKIDMIDNEIKNITFSDLEIAHSESNPYYSTLFWTGKESLSKLKNEDWYSTKRTELYIEDNMLKDKNNEISFYYNVVSNGVICLASNLFREEVICREVTEKEIRNFCLYNIY
ncbi:4'-phosphopantetheinyl transferase family protein [Streptococcus anginosus]|jgi:hypothetical protein|uniref:4'-phosphopantetheinyl transferase superfamily protein n=4 Tax=Bacillati TaxID=1783272 RepID=A0A412PQ71_STRAP|nr:MULTISPECIES: hypothetical protein [Streptococcus]EMG33424.1 4'-phosphopantetheinyl transferase [Streptococcus oralis subsp. tigurinus AZ_3a]KAA9268126.1 hypothetical protein F6I20_10990 [Streptococcus anginosus]MCW0928354.1 hypothetical protein [Streptococcus anginosus]MCW0986922.1 hypothetical protein [Streptococcus anginosus]MCW1042225.1 hypothetical protein [Streptococcus anginosus]